MSLYFQCVDEVPTEVWDAIYSDDEVPSPGVAPSFLPSRLVFRLLTVPLEKQKSTDRARVPRDNPAPTRPRPPVDGYTMAFDVYGEPDAMLVVGYQTLEMHKGDTEDKWCCVIPSKSRKASKPRRLATGFRLLRGQTPGVWTIPHTGDIVFIYRDIKGYAAQINPVCAVC